MTNQYKTKSVLVYDSGLFPEMAVLLSKSFGKTYYYCPRDTPAFPKSTAEIIGDGIPGVERISPRPGHRVESPFDVIDEVDLWCFFDCYEGGFQDHLRTLGKRVWGAGKGDELELLRAESKTLMRRLGIPIGKYEVVKGLDALRVYLKEHDDVWVKVATTRGDFETFHADNYQLIEPKLDDLEHNLGAVKTRMQFIVEDTIHDAVELAIDWYSIDGQYPTSGMVGLEVKDKGYICRFEDDQEMLQEMRDNYTALSGTLEKYQYRQFLSLESLITQDGTARVTDPACRMGSPPGELQQVMITNLADIIWEGAGGTCIDPIPAAKYGAELVIHSTWAERNWQAIQFPEKLRDNIKFKHLTMIDGDYYMAPQSVGVPSVGAIVATGDTLEEATEGVLEIAEQVKGYYVDIFTASMELANKELEKLKGFGIEL